MSTCVYPTCMMGGGGCDRENDCMAEERRAPGVQELETQLSTAQAEIEDLKKYHRSKEDVALINNLIRQLASARAEIERLKESGAPAQRIRFAQENEKLREQLTLSEAKRAELFETAEDWCRETEEECNHNPEWQALSKVLNSQDKPKILDVAEAAEVCELNTRNNAITADYRGNIITCNQCAEVNKDLSEALAAWRGRSDK